MPFNIQDHFIDESRPLKLRIIGAGFSGIYLGIRIPQRLRNIDLQILEKNDGIGGTWWENRYPGCACDIPAHSYQYTFEPNPHWSAFYAPANEICNYLTMVADKYGVNRFVRLSHRVTSCEWDDNIKRWKLAITNSKTTETYQDEADVLIVARGGLNNIKWPAIPGLHSFKGEVMHSAAWNERYDFCGKKIGVIGGGSSAIQIVPELQKRDRTHISCFVRSRTWISNPFGDMSMSKLGLDPAAFHFSDEQRNKFALDPESYLRFRKIIESDGNTMHGMFHKGSKVQDSAVAAFSAMMHERLKGRPEIAEALIPTFGVGCRRLTPGPGYLEALCQKNVDFVTDNIVAIQTGGVTSHPPFPTTPPFRPPRLIPAPPIQDLITLYCLNFYI
ncbi:FAD/NAD(P)-binding domain-containing protein [Cadophora sp. DSE1049]|nr:FAD/NAD(P)-binding domain-containing protein [Cadophora sp. DSE1049]